MDNMDYLNKTDDNNLHPGFNPKLKRGKRKIKQNAKLQHQQIIDKLEQYIEEQSKRNAKNFQKGKEPNQTHSAPPSQTEIRERLLSIKVEKKLKVYRSGALKHKLTKVTKEYESKPGKKLAFQTTTMEKPKRSVLLAESNFPTDLADKLESGHTTATQLELITGSRYKGIWNKATQCMDGYGIYTYPDGSVYRGYFSQGHFNGYGTLHLASPHNFSYKGTFVDGLLHEIEEMWFDDGLQVKAKFNDWSADFSQWTYCYPKDRRFATEHVEGLPAVGPNSFLTNSKPTRPLGNKQYDVEEGYYIPTSGLIVNRPPPLASVIVPNKDHVKWIVKNCRHGSDIKQDIPNSTYNKVIENNLEKEMFTAEHEPGCNFNQKFYHKRYFAQLCKDHLGAKISDELLGYRSPASSSPCESFSVSSPSLDIQDQLEFGWKLGKLSRDLERDKSTLVADGKKHVAKKSSSISFAN